MAPSAALKHVLDSLSVDVVDLDNVVCDVCVVLVLVVNDSLCVQVISVDCCDDCLVQCCVVVVLSDNCLLVGIVCLQNSLLCWQLDNV